MSMFKGPKAPPPPGAPPPPPERSSAEIQELAAAQRKRYSQGAGGRANTVFTGGLGVVDDGAGTKLLGGGV